MYIYRTGSVVLGRVATPEEKKIYNSTWMQGGGRAAPPLMLKREDLSMRLLYVFSKLEKALSFALPCSVVELNSVFFYKLQVPILSKYFGRFYFLQQLHLVILSYKINIEKLDKNNSLIKQL